MMGSYESQPFFQNSKDGPIFRETSANFRQKRLRVLKISILPIKFHNATVLNNLLFLPTPCSESNHFSIKNLTKKNLIKVHRCIH